MSRLLAACLALATGVGLAVGAPAQARSGAGEPTAETVPLESQPAGPTRARVSTFNVLGASHTAPGGDRKGWETGVVRMGYAVRLIDEHALEIIGFQELQKPQWNTFLDLTDGDFTTFPGDLYGTAAMQNSIAWRTADWTLVSTRMIPVPYFDGNIIRKPLVLLQHNVTGQQVYVFNTHNPSDTRGDAQKWRDEAVRIQIDLVNDLRATSPEIPVLFTGDMNDREKFFCPIVRNTDLEAANGGSVTADGTCRPPVPTRIDWILGTSDVAWTGYTALDEGLVNKTTDHPLFWADATVAPLAVRRAGIRRVVVIDVEGLPSAALLDGAAQLPSLQRLIAEGSSTLNARTARERTTALPNTTSLLTGRRVPPLRGGHGIAVNQDTGATVHEAAGRYVSSVFDIVHNGGRRTALVGSRTRLALLSRSWDALHGGADPAGDDDGTAKIDRVVTTTDDAGTTAALTAMLAAKPPAFTLAEYSAPGVVGHRQGFASPAYDSALESLDRAVGEVLATLEARPRLLASTVLVLTANSGGSGTSSRDAEDPRNYTVPLVVWGSGVPAAGDLYAMNPAWADPGTTQPGYATATPPIRAGDVAGLVTGLLALPAIPGSTLNPDQRLNVLLGP